MFYFLIYHFFTFEYWRKIPDTNYWASNMGNIMSEYNMEPMFQATHPVGYKQVNMRIEGKRVTKRVHKMMMLAFEGESCGMDVNHIDGVKDHNFLWNLEYSSKSDNQKHAVRSGLKKSGYIDSRSRPIMQMTRGGLYIQEFSGVSVAGKELGLNKAHISECCNGKRKTEGGFRWEYKLVP